MAEVIGFYLLTCYTVYKVFHIPFLLTLIVVPAFFFSVVYITAVLVHTYKLYADGKLNISCALSIHDYKVTEADKLGVTKVCRRCGHENYEPDLSYLSHPFNSDTY